jgi:hypothetical protein
MAITPELMPHQLEAVENLGNGKILWGGVGLGKTRTALAYYQKKEAPLDIYVITTAKKRDSLDWEQEAVKFGISTNRDLSSAGRLVVDSWNNIGKYEDIEDSFFIFDEQRVVGSGAWVKSFIRIARKNRWILLTATPGDQWTDYVPVFVANGFYRNKTQFAREHVLYASYSRYPKIVRYLEVETLEKYRNLLLVEMPYQTHHEIVEEEIICDYDVELFNQVLKKRWNVYDSRPLRDVAEMFRVMRRVVNSDPSRLTTSMEVLLRHRKVIVFYSFDYELEILRSWCAENRIEWSEWNGHNHQQPPEGERWVYLVNYMAGAEGWNCTYSDTILFYSLTYSWRTFMQAKGRIRRLNNEHKILYYYVLMSNSVIDKAIRNAQKHKKMFNERTWFSKQMASDQGVLEKAAWKFVEMERDENK